MCREVRVARTRSIAVAGATARGVRDPDEHERDECRGQRRTRSSHRQCKWRLREREGVTVDLPARFASRKKNTCPTRQIVAPKSHTRGRRSRGQVTACMSIPSAPRALIRSAPCACRPRALREHGEPRRARELPDGIRRERVVPRRPANRLGRRRASRGRQVALGASLTSVVFPSPLRSTLADAHRCLSNRRTLSPRVSDTVFASPPTWR